MKAKQEAAPKIPKTANVKPDASPAQTLLSDPKVTEINDKKASNPLPERDIASNVERLSLKVGANGALDTTSVREKSEARVKDFLRKSYADPEVRNWAGLEVVGSAKELEQLFKDEQFGQLLDVIVGLEVAIASTATGLPMRECREYLEWSEKEHGILDGQGARVINRYVPREWLERADLYLLIMSLVMFTMTKWTRLSAHAEKIKKATANAVNRTDEIPNPKPSPMPAQEAPPVNGNPSTESEAA